jgi:hypothetical protein
MIQTDVAQWLQFLEDFNGQCYFPDKYWVANDVLQLFTDSSGNPNLGCGAYCSGYWVQFQDSILPNNKVSYILGQQEDHQLSLEIR